MLDGSKNPSALDPNNPADFDKLSESERVRTAYQKFGNGAVTDPRMAKIIEAGIPGANNDGILTDDEIKGFKDKKGDKAFLASVGKAGSEMASVAVFTPSISSEHDFSSEGGIEISDTVDASKQFTVAAQGNDLPDNGAPETDNTLTLGNKGPGFNSNPSMTLSLNKFAPSGPNGMG